MQTFLPYADFAYSAQVLDRARLGKQRVEVLQILKALNNGGGWSNHPATRMWQHHTNALVSYGIAVCEEWRDRGYADTCLGKILEYEVEGAGCVLPSWLGRPEFHAAHRSNLLRKDAQWYRQFDWAESDDLPYLWPV